MRLLLIQPYKLPETSQRPLPPAPLKDAAALLEGVEWELHPGPLAPHGDGGVETREEFALVGAARLPIVREACSSSRYDAVVMLGGGDPGFYEAQEVARRYKVPITACAWSQMHVAATLGDKFSIMDVSETHVGRMYDLVVRYQFTERCASIRNLNFPLPRPGFVDERPIHQEREHGEASSMLDAAVTHALAAIEQDGAEVLIFGCSAAFWLAPLLRKRLEDLGWDVPVLEGNACAIALARTLAGLKVSQSAAAFPVDRPRRFRARRRF